MNILITGGNGFVATHLKNFLDSKHTVYALGKDQLNCLEPQEVNKFFDTHEVDVVIHTALTGREQLFDNSLRRMKEGLGMWYNIYNNRHRYKQLIQYGSAYELNLSRMHRNATLKDVLNSLPMTAYGNTKNCMARMCSETENFYTLRLFGHFHHTESDHRFFKNLSKTSKFTIQEDKKFDYFNLEDTLTVTEFIINEKPVVRDINLVYPEKLLISEQVDIFCKIKHFNPEINILHSGFDLTGDSSILSSFNLQLQGLESGFKKY
jgi:nucleoside-diphosphate-sugar epimerase